MALNGSVTVTSGTFGVLFAANKQRWLVNRFLTERLRQFHFQTLILLAPDIVQAADSGQWDDFTHKRANLLVSFRQDVILMTFHRSRRFQNRKLLRPSRWISRLLLHRRFSGR